MVKKNYCLNTLSKKESILSLCSSLKHKEIGGRMFKMALSKQLKLDGDLYSKAPNDKKYLKSSAYRKVLTILRKNGPCAKTSHVFKLC